ncbi:MAG: pyridoxamine 5'-phosphate oxidase family protein [Longibaculum sp.]
MIHFEREVIDPKLINEMLKYFDHVHLGIHDDDGYPYVVPLNFGYEIKNDKLYVYTHFMKRGHKLDLIRKNPRVCLQFSLFHDFPDCPYKGHRHDYRSVIAKGVIRIIDANEDYETYQKGYNLLYTCNHREIVPLENRHPLPAMYIGEIVCDMKNVTAKSEFPLRTKDDVPFMDVYSLPKDDTPFDISDIIEKNKKE